MKQQFKDKWRRGKERLRGSRPASDANTQPSTPPAPPSTSPDDDAPSRKSGVSANVIPTNTIPPEPEGAASAALTLPIIQDRPGLWSRARDRLPPKDKKWLVEADRADDSVNNIIKLIKEHRDAARKWAAAEDTASTALAWLHKFREIGDVISSYDPVHLALPWAGVRFILQCTLAYQENVILAMESVEQTARMVHRCQIHELLYPQEPALESALVDLYTSLLVLHVRVGRFLSPNSTDRYAWTFGEGDDIKDLMSNLAGREEEVNKEVAVCQGKQVSEISIKSEEIRNKLQTLSELRAPLLRVDQNVLSVLHTLEVNEVAKVLGWISPIPYNLHHKLISETRTNETCEWAIERPQFREWISESQSITLWLQAPAGRGKTYITSKVIDVVESTLQGGENHEGFAFFYCKQTEENRRLALPILQSLVRQLVAPKYLLTTATRPYIHSDIERLYTEAKMNGSGWTLNLCQRYLTLILNLYPRTTLVLDALDECNTPDRTILLNTFDSLARDVLKPLKIFISSRPEGDIRQRLISLPNIEITASHNTDDISKFIIGKMQGQSPWTPVLARNVSLREDVPETLIRKSEGMFQYAFLQIGQLMSLDNKEDIQDRLKRLPTGLTSTYDEIYQKIMARSPHSRDVTLRAIKFVLGSDEPIPITVLGTLVRIDVDAETVDDADEPLEDVLPGWCANLLTVDRYNKRPVWRPSHFSVVEYFDNLWGMSGVNTFVAKAFLVFLLSEPPPPDPKTASPMAQYLKVAFGRHIAAEDQPDCNAEVSRLLKSFFGSPRQGSAQYSLWAPALSWFREEIFPTRVTPAIVMSFLPIYHLLRDWWESTDDDDWKFTANKDGHCLLTLAAREGSEEICASLLRRGLAIDPENEGVRWGSPLVAAAANGQGHILEFLLENGADVNRTLSHGEYGSALVTYDTYEDADILLRHGADPNRPLKCGVDGSPLARAARRRDFDVAELLIQAGADVNQELQVGEPNALTAAVEPGSRGLDMVRFLIGSGADVNQGGALESAVLYEELDIVEALVENGADINIEGQRGMHGSPLIAAACLLCDRGKLVQFLITKGANVNQVCQQGDYGTALVAAASRSILDNIRLLLENGAEVNPILLAGKYGSPLAAAAHRMNTEVLEFLIESGADVNQRLRGGEYGSALSAAATVSDFFIVDGLEYLIKNGAEVNMVLEGGFYGSALIAAAHCHAVRCLQSLINHGANVNLHVETGLFGTALNAARAVPATPAAKFGRGRPGSGSLDDIVDLLVRHGAKD